jgi:predicted CoA-substrate-specific enzyme activase
MESRSFKTISGQHQSPEKSTRALGICLGASTVSLVQVEKAQAADSSQPNKAGDGPRVLHHFSRAHEGDPKETLRSELRNLSLDNFHSIAVTGRRFRKYVNLSSIPEPEAVEYAYRFIKPPDVACPAVVSAGGETFMVYVLDGFGKISNVVTGNKCASGTGEFLLQQLRRMDVSLQEAARWAAIEEPYHVSGRCSVFCKSDCTHATNKGVPKSKVTAGLCRMMADKILELLKRVPRRNIMITGGTSGNQMMIHYLRQEIPGLIVPEEAPYFEALGAGLWALDHDTAAFPGIDGMFTDRSEAFDTFQPLADFEKMVSFKTVDRQQIAPGDVCILGLDVGSTTTKAVLLRREDNAVLASEYLRTNGDPVGASRQCYRSTLEQICKFVGPTQISIVGLGVCGSGRQIAGLHALTDGIINEIIAHATAAVYFDPKVDTIFEIGGQDAKYTYITNSVPSDYAMNEACSAGTGSFLEESAYETLGVDMTDIADIASKGKHPPNFNDQCAAFIASDIKNAIHEGVLHEDIVAGLVYSIAMNYNNRVKGNRPVGEKIFMQGGVCYNHAVPLAMAALVGKPIVVPPEPGLMGAFGVALEVKKRIDAGLMAEQYFNLKTLIKRSVTYGKPFVCKGGSEGCDRRCEIAMIEMEGKKYPFGGACNRYYNLRQKVKMDASALDLVRVRQQHVLEIGETGHPNAVGEKPAGRIGFNRSFMVNTFYPLYATFFSALGFQPILPDTPSQKGIDQKEAAFCYPAELAHGFFYTLLHMDPPPDVIFLPHFKSVPISNGQRRSQMCPFVQAETFLLQTTFRKKIDALKKRGTKIFTPLLDFYKGWQFSKKAMIETAAQMGFSRKRAKKAFEQAFHAQKKCNDQIKEMGRKALEDLEANPKKTAVVIFARPYNGFVDEAHMGIPHKLATRGVSVLPFDCLPIDGERSKRHMYWGLGEMLMKAARYVRRHPQLFGTYITNFSCGPDSFLIGYFREIMGRKPSLTLELDSHTADAGLETRIEAFLDIVTAYKQLLARREITRAERKFYPARVALKNGSASVITSTGEHLPLTDPKVTLLLPSMGKLSSEALSAVFRGEGFNAKVHPPADDLVLKLGRGNTSCKECLPLILTTGTLLNYTNNGRRPEEIVVYFMTTGSGPCRFGQYRVFMEDLVKRLRIPNVALLSLSSEDGYEGMRSHFYQKGWWAVVVADIMEDIRSMMMTNALETESALGIFDEEWKSILRTIEDGRRSVLENQLRITAERFRQVAQKHPIEEVPRVLLTGEIFVRRDELSRRYLTEHLADRGFATICSPVAEWLYYCDYLIENRLADYTMPLKKKIGFVLKKRFMVRDEKRFKHILSESGFVHTEPLDIRMLIRNASPFISKNLSGEAVLTVGSSLTEVATNTCGVIAIGPFGCMPNRISESILNETMNRRVKMATDPHNEQLHAVLQSVDDLPFLAIESDGSPFPQLIDAKLETFLLRARRLHGKISGHGSGVH